MHTSVSRTMNSMQIASNPHAKTFLVIVMGVAGSGKSTLAKALGDIYKFEYLDGDDFHSPEARSLMSQGIPLTDEQRAPWVANMKQRLQDNAKRQEHTVLAFSGLKQKHRDALRSAGLYTITLYLNGNKDTIQERIAKRKDHFMAPALLASQFASMEDPLSEADVYAINILCTPEQVIQQARKIIDAQSLELPK